MYSCSGIAQKKRSIFIIRLFILACISTLVSSYASAWWNSEWAYRKPLVLDTSSIKNTGELDNVPVLIRLHEGVFHFKDAHASGADIRFVSGDDKTPLKYHIEKYDTASNLAFVWVNVPKVKLSDKTSIWMYYGNPKAEKGDTPSATYDGNQSLIYHFAEIGTPVSDSTSYANKSTSTVETDSGIIGNSAVFKGTNSVIVPASPSLALTPESKLTWSIWVKPATQGSTSVIYSRRENNQAFIVGLNQGVPYLSINNTAGAVQTAQSTSSLTADWHHIAVIAEPNKIDLLVDGQVVSSLASSLPTLSGFAVLGADAAAGSTIEQAAGTAQSGFAGNLDELSISKQARSVDFIKAQVLNQSVSNGLVTYGEDEQTSTWKTGFLGIILGALTVDGWIIIAVLAIMAILSWIVMIRKGRAVLNVLKANEAFQNLYSEVNGDFAQLENTISNSGSSTIHGQHIEITESERELIKKAPLYHIFHLGEKELASRLAADEAQHQANLSPQSIEAIRAKLDSQLAKENQELNKNLVLLTIAISGGPFLGLLGTVVGVMITFAAIASSGDVNINAIAPGVAGALAATVAGLLVAIPALFGYNFLITRIKDAVSQMYSFLNVIVTRMAESYANPSSLLPKKERE
nr:DUF2341 domain-containing protein [Acinetobacter sp. Marseille-Q1620]